MTSFYINDFYSDEEFEVAFPGPPGESQADILRRTGQYGVLPTDTDAQVMAKLNSSLAAVEAEMLATGSAQVLAAALSASAAQTSLLALQMAISGVVYEGLFDPKLLALPNGQGGYVIDRDKGAFYLVKMVSGAPVIQAEFSTEWLDRHNGVKLWKFAKGDAQDATVSVAAGSAAVTASLDRWTARDVGKVICLKGAGASGRHLASRITGFTDARRVTIGTACGTTLAATKAQWGTDDTEAVNAAIAMAVGLGVGRVNAGGPAMRYLVAGAEATLGYFPGDSDPNRVPFKRGTLRMFSGLQVIGNGAAFLLSGGRSDPGGLFYNTFWDGSTLEDVRFEGVELDGNLPMQNISRYAAGTSDNAVWQHGHGITSLRARNMRIDRCKIHGFRGSGVTINGSDFEITGSTFYDNFSHDIGGEHNQSVIEHNRFIDGECDSRWVGALDIEKLDAATPINDVFVRFNLFDFRKGLTPVERTISHPNNSSQPLYATDSAEALAARRHYRRACTFSFFYGGFPGNVYNGSMRRIVFCDNTIYQGSADAFNWVEVDFSRNVIMNTSEAIVPANEAIPNALTISQAANSSGDGNVTGLYGATAKGNRISHDLPSLGIQIQRYAETDVADNIVRYARQAAIRLNACSGTVRDNTAIDVGVNDDWREDALRGQDSSAIVVFGVLDGGLSVRNNKAIDTRGSPVTSYAVYVNAAVRPLVEVMFNSALNTRYAGMPIKAVTPVREIGNYWYRNDTYEVPPFRAPYLVTNDATLYGQSSFESTSGDLNVVYRAPTGKRIVTSWLDNGTLQYQQRYEGGVLLFQPFDGNTGGPLALLLNDDGTATVNTGTV